MKVTYYGHSCLGVEVCGSHLLFDPFISPNPLAEKVDIDSIPADYILLTHAHMDHVADFEAIAKRTGATLISNYEIVTHYGGKGFEKAHPLNQGGCAKFDFGKVKYVNAIHSSSFADGTYGGNPGGFVIETTDGHFYISGDTALTYDMKLIGEAISLDWAALCIGDNFTMGVDDAIRAADFVNVSDVIGVHYDTFPPIQIDHAKAIERFSEMGKQLHLMEIGTSTEL